MASAWADAGLHDRFLQPATGCQIPAYGMSAKKHAPGCTSNGPGCMLAAFRMNNNAGLNLNNKLLDFGRCASFFKLLQNIISLRLRHPFLDRLGQTVNKFLGFLQAQAGDGAHDLDHIDPLFSGT